MAKYNFIEITEKPSYRIPRRLTHNIEIFAKTKEGGLYVVMGYIPKDTGRLPESAYIIYEPEIPEVLVEIEAEEVEQDLSLGWNPVNESFLIHERINYLEFLREVAEEERLAAEGKLPVEITIPPPQLSWPYSAFKTNVKTGSNL